MRAENHNNSQHRFKIEERRRQVASLLTKSLTQTEIGQRLSVDQSTISDDIKALKQMSQRFIFDLAKSDLAYYYKQCLQGIDECKREAWKMYSVWDAEPDEDNAKHRIAVLKVAIQAEEAKFRLLFEGPSMMTVKAMSDRLDQIEESFQQEANR